MKLYTKQGDDGNTQVFTREIKRVRKSDILLQNYGNLDELNAHIGLLHAFSKDVPDLSLPIDLTWIQHRLFDIGFAMSDEDKLTSDFIERLEQWIDLLSEHTPPQTTFILPGGSKLASQAHICRTVTRRCERSLVTLSDESSINPLALQFINRLSDLFFAFARYTNHHLGEKDIKV